VDISKLDTLAKQAATGSSRRQIVMGLLKLIVGGVVAPNVPPIRSARSQTCLQDLPTIASLTAARNTITGQSTETLEVPLSPGGCIQYKRARYGLVKDGQVIGEVYHQEVDMGGVPVVVLEDVRLNNQLYVFGSTQRIDSDMDGFSEWQVDLTRQPNRALARIPVGTTYTVTTVATDFDPISKSPVRRETATYPGDGTMHIILEEGSGTLNPVYDYTGPSLEMQVRPGAVRPRETITTFPCPTAIQEGIVTVFSAAAVNGAACLIKNGLTGKGLFVLLAASAYGFQLNCTSGTDANGGGMAAGTDPEDAAAGVVSLVVNTDWWSKNVQREGTIFHELFDGGKA
jgi:hypothetical protein